MAKKNRPNPFDPAQPAKETFVGREALLKELVHGLREGKSYELSGPVGIGKTSLLLEVQRRMVADCVCRTVSPVPLTVYVACEREHDHAGLLFSKIANAVAEGLSQQCGRLCPQKAQREAETATEEGKLRDILEVLLRWAFAETKRNFRVVLLLDALHRISEKTVLRKLLGPLNNDVDRQHANVVLTGRHPLAEVDPTPTTVSTLLHLISSHPILKPLLESETAALLDIAMRLGWNVAAGSAEVAQQTARGHPYRLQYYLHASLEQYGEITPKSLSAIHTPGTEAYLNQLLVEPADLPTQPSDSVGAVTAAHKSLVSSPDVASAGGATKSSAPAASGDPVDFLVTVEPFFVSQHIIAGKYVRYATEDIQHLKSEAVRIMDACTIPSRDRENFLVWGHPGEGKTFFVSEVAKQLKVHYVEINLNDSKKVPDAPTLIRLLTSITESKDFVLCALDESDKRSDASGWLYSSIFPFLDSNKNKSQAESPNKVFVLIGSKQPDFAAFQEEIRSRVAGKDLLRRVVHREITIPRLNVGDRMVTALSMIWSFRPESNKIVAANSIALAYLLATHPTNGAIAEATGKALAHVRTHETSFTADHLQLKLEEWEAFHKRYPSAKSTLLKRFVQMHS